MAKLSFIIHTTKLFWGNFQHLMQNIPVFLFRVEVRAGFSAVVIAVSYRPASVELGELCDELQHSCLLAWCSGVYSLPCRVLPPDIAYSYTVSIVTFTVCARFCESAAFFHGSIAFYDVMITASSETSLLVAYCHFLYTPVMSRRRVCAVYNYLVYIPHGSWI